MNKPELIENRKEIPREMKVNSQVGQALQGKYKISVIDKDENVVSETDWKSNLILNQGMDGLAAHLYADIMTFAMGGVGTRSSNVYTSDSSGSVSGNTLTLTPGFIGIPSLTASAGGYVSVVQSGDVLQFDDSSQVTVLAVSNLTASVAPSSTIPLQPFTIWKTSQVGLQNEVHRVGSGNYFTGVGYCQSTSFTNIFMNRRAWDFNFETSSVTYTEVGVGWANTGSNTVFSRVLLTSPVTIGIAQKMRLIYELDITILPSGSAGGFPFTASISGWPVPPSTDTGGFYNIGQYFISSINNDGSTNGNNFAALDPACTPQFYMSNFSGSLLATGVAQGRGGTAVDVCGVSIDPYVVGSYQCFKNGTFAVAQLPRNDLHSIGIGAFFNGQPYNQNSFNCVFNQPQTKTNVQTLTLSFVYNWGRILSL